jgi:Mrp family chromosome partitioning ATPase/capsular polysaccharide biosynthesis protein
MEQSPASTDASEYIRPLWSRKWLILTIVVIATAGTYAYYTSAPKRYGASTRIFVETSALDQALFGADVPRDDRNTRNQATLLHSREVAKRAAREVRYHGDPATLLSDVTVTPETGADFIAIQATADNPRQAADVANAFAHAFALVRSDQLRQNAGAALRVARKELDKARNRAARKELQSRVNRLEVIESLPAGRAEQLDPAVPSSIPLSPKPRRNALFAFVLSLMLACLAAFGLDRLDRRLRRLKDVKRLYGFPILAVLPRTSKPNPMAGGELTLAESLTEPFRTLRMNIELETLDRPARRLLVTSAIALEGKSTVVRNLALVYRESGLRVVVVDADLRRPSVHEYFHVAKHPGLTDVLTGREELDAALQAVPVQVRGLRTLAQVHMGAHGNGPIANDPGALLALTSGLIPANPPALLAADKTRAVLDDVSSGCDVVLIDCPPMLAFSDVLPLLAAVDGVIIVSRLGLTTTMAAQRLGDQLRRLPGLTVLGVVVNNVAEHSVPGGGYGPGPGAGPAP